MKSAEEELRRELLLEDKLLGQQRRRGQTAAYLQCTAAATFLVGQIFYAFFPLNPGTMDFRLVLFVVSGLAVVPLTLFVCVNLVREARHAIKMVRLRNGLADRPYQASRSRYSWLIDVVRQMREAA